ncbi:MAG: hypothetical protein OXI05_12685 [Bacteroidota bacterium]|nr:hypothetical protein [Bacteroidota bacterium]
MDVFLWYTRLQHLEAPSLLQFEQNARRSYNLLTGLIFSRKLGVLMPRSVRTVTRPMGEALSALIHVWAKLLERECRISQPPGPLNRRAVPEPIYSGITRVSRGTQWVTRGMCPCRVVIDRVDDSVCLQD